MAFTRVHDVKLAFASRFQDFLNRFNRSPRKGEIVSHFVDVPAFPAEISLHVNHQKGGLLRAQIAIIRPPIRIRFDLIVIHG